MVLDLYNQNYYRTNESALFKKTCKRVGWHVSFLLMMLAFTKPSYAQGTWTSLKTLAPHTNGGAMIILSDGTVMCKTFSGGKTKQTN